MESYKEVYSQSQLETIKNEFARIKDNCYLDHTGATLYSDVQIAEVYKTLSTNLYGNPHAYNISSKFTGDAVDQVRFELLDYFNTTPEEYSLIFVSNATAGLKIVGENFNYGKNDSDMGSFLYLEDNHTSVIGMREYAAKHEIIPHMCAFEILNKSYHREKISYETNSLFAYPAQCNFTGTKFPLSWIENIQNGALNQVANIKPSNWFCMLDAASFAPSNKLDLSLYNPDFVCVSFYKIFGYPTGVGALLVRNSSAYTLQKKYFGGGTVQMTLPKEHIFREAFYKRFEDGTVAFLSILALRQGIETHKRLSLNMDLIANHTFNLAKYVYKQMLHLHHSNGKPVAILYHDTDFENGQHQGGIVNFNILRNNGEFIGYSEVLQMANLYKIHLRTGCLCNPGACRRQLGLSIEDAQYHFKSGHVCGDQNDLIDGFPTGSVRISFGYMTTHFDADKFLEMIRDCFVTQPVVYKTPENWTEFQNNYKQKFSKSYLVPEKVEKVARKFGQNQNVAKEEIINSGTETNFGVLKYVYLYPIKSCSAFSVEISWPIDERGLRFDREWMVVTNAGVCLTQKQEPKLCCLKPSIDLEKGNMELFFEGFPSISVPLNLPESQNLSEVTLCQSKICGDRVKCYDCGETAANWLNECLNRSDLRLLRQSPENSRINKKGENSQLSLANQAQYLLLNLASIKMLGESIPDFDGNDMALKDLIARFRANFIVDVGLPLVESDCQIVQIGDLDFKCMGPCTRCQMICIDQNTGEKSVEPLKTLSSIMKGKIRFGIYLSVQKSDKPSISLGEKVVFK